MAPATYPTSHSQPLGTILPYSLLSCLSPVSARGAVLAFRSIATASGQRSDPALRARSGNDESGPARGLRVVSTLKTHQEIGQYTSPVESSRSPWTRQRTHCTHVRPSPSSSSPYGRHSCPQPGVVSGADASRFGALTESPCRRTRTSRIRSSDGHGDSSRRS